MNKTALGHVLNVLWTETSFEVVLNLFYDCIEKKIGEIWRR